MIPIPVRTTGRMYANVFVVLLFCWPLLLLVNDRKPSTKLLITVCVLIVIMIGSYILNYVRCSSPYLTYWAGLRFIAGVWETGCVNITIFIILPLLFIVHLQMAAVSPASFFSGKTTAQRAFLRACWRFSRRAFNLQAAEAEFEMLMDSIESR